MLKVDQNVKLSVEETHPDPRYVQLQDEEGQQTLLHQEIQGTLSVLRFPGKFHEQGTKHTLFTCMHILIVVLNLHSCYYVGYKAQYSSFQ